MNQVKKAIAYGVLAVVIVLLFSALPLYVDWLWFKDLGYQQVFTTILSSRVLLGVVTAVLFFLVVWSSARYALKSNANRIELYTMEANLPIFLDRIIQRGVEYVVLFGSLILAFLVGLEASTNWESWLAFRNAVPFGQADPVFNKDLSFYVFQLDFLHFAYRTVMLALVAATAAAIAMLYLTRTVDLLRGKLRITNVAAGQVGILLALIALLQAYGFRLNAYKLLYTPSESLFGAGYADITVRLLSYNVAIAACVVGACLILFAAKTKNLQLAAVGLFMGIAVNAVIGGGVGALVQRLVVNPDELNKEKPYLARHLEATRLAYGLNDVVRKDVEVERTITAEDLENNQVTIQSIRLWDYRPLQAAYAQLQEIQQYYAFNEVDIDRYTIDGSYRQVMLSVRELDPGSLPSNARTWVNLRLRYTHGYGIVMSPVNEVSEEGLPRFFIQDMPARGKPNLKIERPGVYFGENTTDYVIVNSRSDEFHYPSGSENVNTRYSADSGVALGNTLRRSLLATRFADLNILISGQLTRDSRILFRRAVQPRISALAPFLTLDGDPYIVLNEGRLVWIQDAYTTTDRFPYSQPSLIGPAVPDRFGAFIPQRVNYIRNSVKITVDAYTGEVGFYVFDEKDPLIKTYQKMFPGMFRPRAQFPESLLAHVRYPEDLFNLQTRIFQTFHMKNVETFYNKGDVWAIPRLEQADSTGDTGRAAMEPYYVVMRLPDAEREEFLMLMPLSRANKDNMVAWMAARCDGENYGQIVLYEFPKGEQYFGPAQIQSRANQNTEISEQMTLWNQQKSRVFRGNLLALPIERAMLYVEPIYLQSVTAKIPELKRVIVAIGNEVVMEETLEQALAVLVRGQPPTPTRRAATGASAVNGSQAAPAAASSSPQARQALDIYRKAMAAQRAGDWAEYGRHVEELGRLLEELDKKE